MAKLEKIEFFKMPNVRIIGFEVTNSLREGDENPVPALWEKIFSDGTIEKLKNYLSRLRTVQLAGWEMLTVIILSTLQV